MYLINGSIFALDKGAELSGLRRLCGSV